MKRRDMTKLKEKRPLLDEGPSKLENFGYIMSLLASFVVVFMYGWIVVFTFFHPEFIERMFSGGLNFLSWTQDEIYSFACFAACDLGCL